MRGRDWLVGISFSVWFWTGSNFTRFELRQRFAAAKDGVAILKQEGNFGGEERTSNWECETSQSHSQYKIIYVGLVHSNVIYMVYSMILCMTFFHVYIIIVYLRNPYSRGYLQNTYYKVFLKESLLKGVP